MQRISSGDWGKLNNEAQEYVKQWLAEKGLLISPDHPDYFDLEVILAERGVKTGNAPDSALIDELNKLFDKSE